MILMSKEKGMKEKIKDINQDENIIWSKQFVLVNSC